MRETGTDTSIYASFPVRQSTKYMLFLQVFRSAEQINHDILIGVDVGGTFTDAVAVFDGRIYVRKTLTTPDQADGAMQALSCVLCDLGSRQTNVRVRFAHGSTVATNALLERKGARTVALFSENFTDILEIGRQTRESLYRPNNAKTPPIVSAASTIGVSTNVDLTELVSQIVSAKAESVAVCLLRSYLDHTVEAELVQQLRTRLPDLHIVASCELTQEFREYERASTTTIDAFLTPVVAPYLRKIGNRAVAAGIDSPLVMQSNGGLGNLVDAQSHAAKLVLSGPAGGLIAAQKICSELDFDQMTCMDVGGTSCDVAVVQPGELSRNPDRKVSGLPLQLAMVDIHTVGAGASSIVWMDKAGALRVGPNSAGSNPGPAAYGRGGKQCTITDCHVVLGNLEHTSLQHWNVSLDVAAARRAVASLISEPEPSDDEVESLAASAIAVVCTNMAEAVGEVTIARGLDPASIPLLAYGGAGGLHACAIADALGCRTIVIPYLGGVLSAFGLSVAPQRRELSRTVVDESETETLSWMVTTAKSLHKGVDARIEIACDIRYSGQSHSLSLVYCALNSSYEFSAGDAQAALDDCRARFADQHRANFGHTLDAAIEIATVRVSLVNDVPTATLQDSVLAEHRTLESTKRNTTIFDLPNGTVLMPQHWAVSKEVSGCIVLEHRA